MLVTYSYAQFRNGPVIFYYFVSCYLVGLITIFTTLQAYNISWTCSGCYYYQVSGSKLSLKDTTTRVSNLLRDHTYNFSVYANTNFGHGELSSTIAMIGRYFGQVQNLRQSFTNYTLTLQWDKPGDVDAKDIKVSSAIHSLARNVLCFDRFCPKYKLFILVTDCHSSDLHPICRTGQGMIFMQFF